ncbi:MAG TPA: DUF6116 family protein [Dokdonella sp.]|uniref:Uncharacterized protein n=1 Tax=Rhodanobacter denitrificans TaxID=666685 RepID=A0A2W5MY57_9GAMM|nr:DUF6116 family protein [Dokdonella sp.]PZQ18670.1 MAG: hypothetical protein DI564_05100 [Rhodanobacter denitrificans]HUD42438.1 DUF6116 family protein [Dokdonella sp.]
MPNPLTRRLLRWAQDLRFPRLALLTIALFVADVLIPDFIPFIDEILLGLASLLLANLRRRPRLPQGG